TTTELWKSRTLASQNHRHRRNRSVWQKDPDTTPRRRPKERRRESQHDQLPDLQVAFRQTNTTLLARQAKLSGNSTPHALLSKQMGESRTHSQAYRNCRFCNRRQILPIKFFLLIHEQPNSSMFLRIRPL